MIFEKIFHFTFRKIPVANSYVYLFVSIASYHLYWTLCCSRGKHIETFKPNWMFKSVCILCPTTYLCIHKSSKHGTLLVLDLRINIVFRLFTTCTLRLHILTCIYRLTMLRLNYFYFMHPKTVFDTLWILTRRNLYDS